MQTTQLTPKAISTQVICRQYWKTQSPLNIKNMSAESVWKQTVQEKTHSISLW